MMCAVYARKSTSQEGVNDDQRSVARQVEHARAYAARKGWTVGEHVYVDDGVSGALFGDKRPGLARLLNALSPRPPFQALIMSEESRLGREAIETGWTLKQIIDAGVRVFFYLEDRERTLDTAMDKVMLSLTNFASEVERERARQRTKDALLRKARAGHVPGGFAPFGYRHEPVFDGDRRVHVRYAIVPEEAEIVRRIFAMAADGSGFKRIAATLNAEGALTPTPRRPVRQRGWSQGTVRDVLIRDAYRGQFVWNRRAFRGVKHVHQRPENEWVARPAPQLRIVTDALWQAAHAQLDARKAIYFHGTNGSAYGRPINGIEARYLLSGMMSCGRCGSSLIARRHRRGRHHRIPVYLCIYNHQRGPAACSNALEIPIGDADAAVLGAVERDVLRIEVLETSLFKALETLRPAPAAIVEARTQGLRAELSRLEAELSRLAAAIASGGELTALVAALQERERRRERVRAELAALTRKAQPAPDPDALLRRLRSHLTDWQGMLRRETPEARKALRALLAGRLIFTPRGRAGARWYEFEGPGTVRPIIRGLVGLGVPTGVIPP